MSTEDIQKEIQKYIVAVLKASAFTQRYELVEMDEVVLRAADLVATDPDAFAKMLPLGGRL